MLIRGMPRSQESSRSSSVNLLFWALASWRLSLRRATPSRRRVDSRAITTTCRRDLMKTPSTTFKVNIDAASARVLRPDPLRIDELALPGLHVSKEIGNDLVLLVGHAAPKMGDALVRLLAVAEVLRVIDGVASGPHAVDAHWLHQSRPWAVSWSILSRFGRDGVGGTRSRQDMTQLPQFSLTAASTASRWSHDDAIDRASSSSSVKTLTQRRLRDEHVAHAQHAQPPELLRRVEDDGREARRHLRIQTDLDARLDFIFALDLRTVCHSRKFNFNDADSAPAGPASPAC